MSDEEKKSRSWKGSSAKDAKPKKEPEKITFKEPSKEKRSEGDNKSDATESSTNAGKKSSAARDNTSKKDGRKGQNSGFNKRGRDFNRRDDMRKRIRRGADNFGGGRMNLKSDSCIMPCLNHLNSQCSLVDCRYYHISKEDEKLYKEHGTISIAVLHQAKSKALVAPFSKPVCKNFLMKGHCDYKDCRFRHLLTQDYEREVYDLLLYEFAKLFGPSRVQSAMSRSQNVEKVREISVWENPVQNQNIGGNMQMEMFARNGGNFIDSRLNEMQREQHGYNDMQPDREAERLKAEINFLMQDISNIKGNAAMNQNLSFETAMKENSILCAERNKHQEYISELQNEIAMMKREMISQDGMNAKFVEMQMKLSSVENDRKSLERSLQHARDDNHKVSIENARLEVKLQDSKAQLNHLSSSKQIADTLGDQMNKIYAEMYSFETEMKSQWAMVAPNLEYQPRWIILKTLVKDGLQNLPNKPTDYFASQSQLQVSTPPSSTVPQYQQANWTQNQNQGYESTSGSQTYPNKSNYDYSNQSHGSNQSKKSNYDYDNKSHGSNYSQKSKHDYSNKSHGSNYSQKSNINPWNNN